MPMNLSGKYVAPTWVNSPGPGPAIDQTELQAMSDTIEKLDARYNPAGDYVDVTSQLPTGTRPETFLSTLAEGKYKLDAQSVYNAYYYAENRDSGGMTYSVVRAYGANPSAINVTEWWYADSILLMTSAVERLGLSAAQVKYVRIQSEDAEEDFVEINAEPPETIEGNEVQVLNLGHTEDSVILRGLHAPNQENDAANKAYVDGSVGGVTPLVIQFTGNVGEAATANQTWADIRAAFNAGRPLEVRYRAPGEWIVGNWQYYVAGGLAYIICTFVGKPVIGHSTHGDYFPLYSISYYASGPQTIQENDVPFETTVNSKIGQLAAAVYKAITSTGWATGQSDTAAALADLLALVPDTN